MQLIPNILSASRILLAPLFVYLNLHDAFVWAAVSMVIFIFAAVTDYLDGYYARRYKVSSSLGTFLDPLADKILTIAGFICIPFIDPLQFPWWIIGVIVFRDVFITTLRVWFDYNGQSLSTSYSAKVKTLVQMVFLYVVLLTGVLVKADGIIGEGAQMIMSTGILGWLFIIVMVITVYTAIEYIYRNRGLFARGAKSIDWSVFAGSVAYIGFLPKIPGTWGSLAVLPLIYLSSVCIHPLFGPLLLAIFFSVITLLATNGMEKILGPDPGECVSDEFAGQAIVFLFIPIFTSWEHNLLVFSTGFLLFRIFDILKPLGISAIQHTEGGWGVLLDDIVAGMYAQMCLLFVIFIVL